MNYRHVGDAGVKVSEFGLGGWLTFGNAMELEQARAVMDKAFDVGINFYDTADGYGRGRCEELWGELLRHRRRQDYVLATKVFLPMSDNVNDRGLSRKHIMESIHNSLRRLRTDYLDLYQCHRQDEDTPLEETIRAFDDLIHQGKIVYWGFSNWTVEQIEKCLKICGDRYFKPKSSQPRYNLLNRDIEEKILPLCAKAGIGQVVYSPLQQGILSGKYKPGQPIPKDSRAADEKQNQFIKKTLEDDELLKKVQRLAPIAKEVGCTMAQLALAWILRHPEISSCIIGATRPEQIEHNVLASAIKLDEATVRKMEEAVE